MGLKHILLQRFANYPVIRDSQGELTNPLTTTVLADTGRITDDKGGSGVYEVLILASASAAAEFVVQHRNAGNDTTIGDPVIFYAPAGVPVPVPMRFEIDALDRLRVLVNANLTGDAVVTIFAQRVA